MNSSAKIIRVLENNGFQFKSQRGSHVKYIKGSRTVIVPHPRKEIPIGTFLSILRQAGISKDEFENRK